MFYRDSVFRENLDLPTPPPILNISTPFTISAFFIANEHKNDLKNKSQAQSGVLVTFEMVLCFVKVEVNKPEAEI
jgi:hypothetical protein